MLMIKHVDKDNQIFSLNNITCCISYCNFRIIWML